MYAVRLGTIAKTFCHFHSGSSVDRSVCDTASSNKGIAVVRPRKSADSPFLIATTARILPNPPCSECASRICRRATSRTNCMMHLSIGHPSCWVDTPIKRAGDHTNPAWPGYGYVHVCNMLRRAELEDVYHGQVERITWLKDKPEAGWVLGENRTQQTARWVMYPNR